MVVDLVHLSTLHLETMEAELRRSTRTLTDLGRWSLAAQLKKVRTELTMELLRRSTVQLVDKDTQLSIAPPGAYSEPVFGHPDPPGFSRKV
jgi:hypothetical protein